MQSVCGGITLRPHSEYDDQHRVTWLSWWGVTVIQH